MPSVFSFLTRPTSPDQTEPLDLQFSPLFFCPFLVSAAKKQRAEVFAREAFCRRPESLEVPSPSEICSLLARSCLLPARLSGSSPSYYSISFRSIHRTPAASSLILEQCTRMRRKPLSCVYTDYSGCRHVNGRMRCIICSGRWTVRRQ
jgi:hypothetical protein